MAKPKLSQVVVFGVDVRGSGAGASAAPDVATARKLASLLQRYQVSATWAFERFDTPVAQLLASSSPKHEIALLWNETPATRSADAFQIAGQLRDRVAQAQQLDISLQSIAADPRGMLPYHSLARYGFRSVRATRAAGSSGIRSIQPQSLRHGLWGVPVSCFWPHTSRLMQAFSLRALLNQQRLVSQGRDALHVVVDFELMQTSGTGCWQQLERVFQQTVQLRSEGKLRSCRLADIDLLVRAETSAQPARSILRRTA
ncbi:MAG: hypothetical protein KDB23_12200 [Planctomycetales bacterium]|nr:hypothetical protein [Planctomycetales bacterium]